MSDKTPIPNFGTDLAADLGFGIAFGVDRKVSEDSVSTTSEDKRKSRFSLLKKNIKKNFKMSSKEKSVENLTEVTAGKKKKSKKNKDKSKIQTKQLTSTEEEQPSTSEKSSKKGSVVRKLSLDKLYSNIKGTARPKDDGRGRRATTPDISVVTMSLQEELKQAESKYHGLDISELHNEIGYEESELSEDYRTPACQSPVGSYIYDSATQSLHDPTNSDLSQDVSLDNASTYDNKTTQSSSELSLESAIQSVATGSRLETEKSKPTERFASKDTSYKNIMKRLDESSSADEKEPEVKTQVSKNLDLSDNNLNLNVSPIYPAEGGSSSTSSTCEASSPIDNRLEFNKNRPLEESLSSFLSNQNDIIMEKTKTKDEIAPKEYNLPDEALLEKLEEKKQDSSLFIEEETQASSDKRECLFKILVIGELGTGKTSIIKRYVHEFFSQHYRATIGVDFALKVLNWDQNTVIRLQLWDIAGQERFGNMTRVYYKEAVGAFIVFDVTRSATFDAVLKWKQDLDSKVQLSNGSPIPCVLLANKCDQPKEGPVTNPEKIEQFCKEHNFSDWFETSAKENINIDQAAKSLVTKILQNDKLSQNGKDPTRDNSKFPLDGKDPGLSDKKSCAC